MIKNVIVLNIFLLILSTSFSTNIASAIPLGSLQNCSRNYILGNQGADGSNCPSTEVCDDVFKKCHNPIITLCQGVGGCSGREKCVLSNPNDKKSYGFCEMLSKKSKSSS